MQIYEAQQLISTVRFLDFKFNINPISHTHAQLTISYNAPDTRDRAQKITLNFHKMISIETLGVKDFLLLVYDAVIESLKHEASELFFVNNIDVYNEHDTKMPKMRLVESMFRIQSQPWQMPHHYGMMDGERHEQRNKLYELEDKYLRD